MRSVRALLPNIALWNNAAEAWNYMFVNSYNYPICDYILRVQSTPIEIHVSCMPNYEYNPQTPLTDKTMVGKQTTGPTTVILVFPRIPTRLLLKG